MQAWAAGRGAAASREAPLRRGMWPACAGGAWGERRTLVGRIITMDDNAGYHNSSKPTGHIEGNPGRLRRIPTLSYAPNDNFSEPQIRAVKAALSNVGLDSVGAIGGELRGRIESGLIDPVKFYDCDGGRSAADQPAQGGVHQKKARAGRAFCVHAKNDAGQGDKAADSQRASD